LDSSVLKGVAALMTVLIAWLPKKSSTVQTLTEAGLIIFLLVMRASTLMKGVHRAGVALGDVHGTHIRDLLGVAIILISNISKEQDGSYGGTELSCPPFSARTP